MYCPHCGKKIPDDSTFCPECGQKVGGQESVAGKDYEPQDDNVSRNDGAAYRESSSSRNVDRGEDYGRHSGGGNENNHHNTPVLITVIIAAAAVVIILGALLIQKNGSQSVTTSSKAVAASTKNSAAEITDTTPAPTKEPTATPSPSPTAAPKQSAPKVIVVKPQATPTPAPNDDEDDDLNDYYVFPYSDTELLTDDDLAGKSAWELTVGRNEICARHGYTFDREDLQAYFNSQSWYYPVGKFDLNTTLSSIELQNMTFIDHYQTAHGLQTSN